MGKKILNLFVDSIDRTIEVKMGCHFVDKKIDVLKEFNYL